jgi:hypothetical protein
VRYIKRNILMRSLLFWGLTKPWLLVSYRHFGTTYGSHFQRWNIQSRLENWTDSLPRNVGNYQTTLHKISEERSSHIPLVEAWNHANSFLLPK